MTNVDWVSRVGDALKHLDEEFVENELAYLALTSKVEKPIVDRLAFRLHRDYGDDRVAVAREFTVRKEIQRVDLAVVVEKTPHLLLEAKAMNGLKENLLPEKQRYPTLVGNDVEKLRGYQADSVYDGTKKVALLLSTYTHSSPEDHWDGIVKYAAKIRKRRLESIVDLKKMLDEHFPKDDFPVRVFGDIQGGARVQYEGDYSFPALRSLLA